MDETNHVTNPGRHPITRISDDAPDDASDELKGRSTFPGQASSTAQAPTGSLDDTQPGAGGLAEARDDMLLDADSPAGTPEEATPEEATPEEAVSGKAVGLRRRSKWPRRFAVAGVVVCVLTVGFATWGEQMLGQAILGFAKVRANQEQLAPLEPRPLPERSVLLAKDGTVLATLYLENRVSVSYDELSQPMIDAIVAAEDRRFFTHSGVDARGIARAFISNLRNDTRQGGSTITQQYVKNLLEAQADTVAGRQRARETTVTRKLNEVFYANDLESRLTKQQILEGYLNTVYFGSGAYGVGAAAGRYFSTTADQLSVAQAATLAGLVRSPSAYDPTTHPEAALARRNEVLAAMRDTRAIDADTYAAAVAEPLGLLPSLVANGCASSFAPFFCDFVRVSLEQEPALGETLESRRARIALGGLTITTTIDPFDQRAATDALWSNLGPQDRVAGAVVSVEPGSGKVRAMAVNRIYGLDVAANQTTVGLATSAYQVGSTFKAFTLAAALESGVGLDTVLPAGSSYRSSKMDNPEDGYYSNAEPYGPSNINLAVATEHSVNTAFVQLEERVGVRRIAEVAKRMGATSIPLDGPNAVSDREGSLTLGAREISPLEMANAYATLASGGVMCQPTGVESIVDRDGQQLTVAPRCTQALTTPVANTVTSLLAGVITRGTGSNARVVGHEVAGKTGTTQDFGAAWFVGYTPQLSSAVWVGDPRGPAYQLRDVNGVAYVYGGTIPARIFSAAMTGQLEDLAALDLPEADPTYLDNAQVVVPDVRGLSASVARARLEALGVRVTGVTSGAVAGTAPEAGMPIPRANQSVGMTAGSGAFVVELIGAEK